MMTPSHWINSFIEEQSLPASYAETVVDHCLPLAAKIAQWSQCSTTPLIVGINGAQGTGKSTLSEILKLSLNHKYGLDTAILSIDDIYLTYAEREQLAQDIHPLLKTRGVPGTHDIKLGTKILHTLKNKTPCRLPVFDKARDERAPDSQWIDVDQAVDVILFEGWCVGARPQQNLALADPVNRLEELDDDDCSWRHYVNDALKGPYQNLFGLIDRLVMLKAPNFEYVHTWRNEQEKKLSTRLTQQGHHDHTQLKLMSPQQIERFIMHYERLTRWMLSEMPDRTDCVFHLNPDHQVDRVCWSTKPSSPHNHDST
ncbi:MAG: hypothetical protein ABGY95_00410 [Rubritalea sp.]